MMHYKEPNHKLDKLMKFAYSPSCITKYMIYMHTSKYG